MDLDEIYRRRCEHCGKPLPGLEGDYCAICSRNLCEHCMDQGCCGHIPAQSGVARDYSEDGAGERT